MNKVAIVTGASSGIGKAISERMLDEGYALVMNGRTLDKTATQAQEDRLIIRTDDLLLPETPAKLLDASLSSFGRVDYLFVNAGTIESASIEDIDIEKMCTMMRLRVEASFRLIYTFLKHMKKTGCGHIFITSSVLGTKTRENSGAYAAANHALEALAESLRMELCETDIQITCIEPGLVRTQLHRDWPVHPQELLNISNVLQPEDIADAVMELIAKKNYIRVPRLMILPKGHRI